MHWRWKWWRRQLPRQRYVNAFNTSLKSYFAETAARLDVTMLSLAQRMWRIRNAEDSVSWLFYCWFFATKRVCQLKVILYSVYIFGNNRRFMWDGFSGILLPILSRKLFALQIKAEFTIFCIFCTFFLSSSLALFRFYLPPWCIYLLSFSFRLVCVCIFMSLALAAV